MREKLSALAQGVAFLACLALALGAEGIADLLLL